MRQEHNVSNQTIQKIHDSAMIQQNANSQEIIKPQARSKTNKAKRIHWFLIILTIFSTQVLCYQNYFYFFMSDLNVIYGIGFSICPVATITHLVFSCKFIDDKWEMFQMYIMLDNIFIALIAALTGLIGMLALMFNQMPPLMLLLMILESITHIIMVGNYRVMLKKCRLKKSEVLSSKISLISACFSYLILAAYYISNPIKTAGVTPQEQQSSQDDIKNFFFLYAFGFFTLYMEIYGKFTDKDGTSQFNFNYQFDYSQDSQQDQQLNSSHKMYPQPNK